VRRYDGLARAFFRRGDSANEYQAIKYLWGTPAVRAIRKLLDAIPTLKFGDYRYRRSALFGIVLVAHLLGISLTEAHARVQASDALRRLFGFEPMSKETRRLRCKLSGQEALREEEFPVRQTVSHFLNRWLQQSAIDIVALIAEETAKVALEAILDHDLDPTRLAVDGSSILSPNRSPRVNREDNGATFHGRQGEPARFGRQLMSIILTDVPFVLVSKISTRPGESPFMGEELLPELSERSNELVKLGGKRGLKHSGFCGAAVSGDLAFNNDPFIKRLYRERLHPAFDQPGWPHVELVGQRRLRQRGGPEVVCDLGTNGALYCACDRWTNAATRQPHEALIARPVKERTPMRQLRGRPGINIHVVCENSLCPHRGVAFYVALGRGPDLERGHRLVDGEENYRHLTSLPRTDIRVAGISFKGRQAIENRHNVLLAHGLLGKKRGSHRRIIYGDFAHDFWYALADLVHNHTLAYNLAEGRSNREVIPGKTSTRASSATITKSWRGRDGARQRQESRCRTPLLERRSSSPHDFRPFLC
jgi:hypothetical protein